MAERLVAVCPGSRQWVEDMDGVQSDNPCFVLIPIEKVWLFQGHRWSDVALVEVMQMSAEHKRPTHLFFVLVDAAKYQ